MYTTYEVPDETENGGSHGGYQLVDGWPHYPEGMQFELGSGVAVDQNDIVYLFTRDIEHWAAHPLAMSSKMGKGTISMFTREGEYLGIWGPSDEPGFALGAHTLYIEKDGMFWVTDRDGHIVKKYTPEGELLMTLGKLGEWGDAPDRFNGPTAVLVQKNGNIVVTDGYWNSRLVFFSPEGEFIKSVGQWGRDPGEFGSPHAVAEDSLGRLLVADLNFGDMHPYNTQAGQIAEHRKYRDPANINRIQIFDAEGNYLDQWTHIMPLSISTFGEEIYASDKMSDLVVMSLDGEVQRRFDKIAIYIHQFAIDSHGDIYVASVYPEHANEQRGPEGPSFRRWTRPLV